MPVLTGSTPLAKTIGIVVVAALAACAAARLYPVAITFTLLRTRSLAKPGNRSNLFSAQRYSIVTLRPSTYPASLRPRRNARTRSAKRSGEALLRNPTTGAVEGWARGVTGQVARAKTSAPKGASDVRFGSEADMCSANSDVRFGPIADIVGSQSRQVWPLSPCALREVSPHDRFGDERRLVLPLDLDGDVACQLQAAVNLIYLCQHETST